MNFHNNAYKIFLILILNTLGFSYRNLPHFSTNQFGVLNDKSRKLKNIENNISQLKEKNSSFISSINKLTNNTLVSWAFNITDTRPFTPLDPVGLIFLTTNIFYFGASLNFWESSSLYANYFAMLVDIAGFISFIYHYTQLKLGPERYEVKIALFIDYIIAILTVCSTIVIIGNFMAKGYIFDQYILNSIQLGIVSLLFLYISWIKSGLIYIIFHGIWHLLSALAVLQIGEAERILKLL